MNEWYPFFAYIERTYGFDSIDSIMLNHKLSDGTNLTIVEVIEHWHAYILKL